MWAALSWPARALRVLLRVLAVPLVGLLLGAAALSWRLAQGPLDIAWLARRIEAASFPTDAPTRLEIGDASIAWQGYQAGAEAGLELRLRDLRVVNRSGAPGAELAQAEATISLLRLFALQVAPRTLALSGLRLRAIRERDGSVALDLGTLTEGDAEPGSGPSIDQTMAELRRPAGTDRGQGLPGLAHLRQLRLVRVHDARVQLLDRRFGATVQARVDDLDLRRQPGGGVKGEAAGQVALGEAVAALQLRADLAPGGGTRIEASLAPLQSGAVARANPALAPVGALDATLQASATLDLSPNLEPRAAELHASTGGGRVSYAGGVVPFESLALDAGADWSGKLIPDQVQLRRLQAVLASPGGGWATTIGVSGQAVRGGGHLSGAFDATLDHARFADLPALWPAAWGGNLRPWLVENVTGGTAREGALHVKVEAPEGNLGAAGLTEASGTLAAEDVTIHWLRPVPPIEHAQALLRVLGPDVIEITIPAATQGPIALRDGTVRFTGLSAEDQTMALTAGVAGQVADVVALLRHPRLGLLDRHPIPMRNPSGALTGKLTVDLPLKKKLDFDEVAIHAQGRLAALHLGGLVAGRDLDRGDVQFDVTADGMKASGTASVAGIASTIGVEMDFRPGPPSQVLQHATLSGQAGPRQFAAAGVDSGGLITAGSAAVNAAYTALRDGSAEVRIKADLRDAGLALLGWRKAPGPQADASATLVLRHDKLAGISAIQAHGPGLVVAARAEMEAGSPSLLRLERIVLGPTQASGEVRFPHDPGGPIRARLAGPVLDLSTELSRKSPPRRGGESETPWVADVRFDRVLLAEGASLTGVVAHAEHDGRRLALLQARSSGPERMQAAIVPQGVGRRVSVRAADGGAVLRALDVTGTVHGGALAIEAQYDDRQPDPPLAGTVDLSEFSVHDAVVVGKLLQALTVYGIADALRGGDGVQFSRLIMPFRYAGDVLDIGEARAFSSSLGLTAQGRVDLGRHAIDVHGTVVPAYALNSALGRIPLIGRLFSPEHGGGLIAVGYGVTGRLADPNVTVNPLSALTPGFLRGLFRMFR